MYLTEKELAEALKININTLYNWRQRGLPYLKVGNRMIRYDMAKVKEWLARYEKTLTPPQK